MNAPDRPIRVLILGAAGRDFHNFNCCFRDDPRFRVVAFTATQIPNIEGRTYPPVLAGPAYPQGIPIHPENTLESLIGEHEIDLAVFSYSDVPHEYVMHMAARCTAAGASFQLVSARATMLPATRPVVAVGAVRTGSGKSQTTRKCAEILRKMGRRIAVVRHPMPYGDLARQVCQRFGEVADLDRHECTIEEREEYELHIRSGNLLFAGVDYRQILDAAERECDVILWDGGNNDMPFYRPDLFLVVADPHRPGHEFTYWPGETNVRLADVILINKTDTAEPSAVEAVEASVRRINPRARVLRAASPVTCDDPDAIRGKRVLLVEDGPTLTHGGMRYGAAYVAAKRFGAAEIVDPRPHAAGSIRGVFEKYPHLTEILPAMGYGRDQIGDLEATINAAPCDLVLVGTPIDLTGLIEINKRALRVRYGLDDAAGAELEAIFRGHPRLW